MSVFRKPVPKAHGETRLVAARGERVELTARCDSDARTALARGLREYLETLSTTTAEGREIRIAKLVDTWPDAMDLQMLPSGAVYATGDGEYEANGLAPGLRSSNRLPDGRYITTPAEYTVELAVEIACRDKAERTALGKLLEDALNPHVWMAGTALVLPHYHGAIGVYELLRGGYEDSPDTTASGRWTLRLVLRGQVTQHRVHGLVADGQPTTRVTVDEGAATP